MLIRSDTRYAPTAISMIILQSGGGAYYYLYRSLYDQCIIFRDQHIGLIPSFCKLLGFEDEYPKVYDIFIESAPEPLDILAPFLGIITDCEKLNNIDDMHGAVSSVPIFMDFQKMLKMPATVRTSIKLSLSVRKEYRVQWSRFFVGTSAFEQVYSGKAHTIHSAPVGSVEDSVGIIEEGGKAAEISYTDDAYDMDNLMRILDAASEATKEKNEFGGSSTTEEVVEERPKIKGGFAMLEELE